MNREKLLMNQIVYESCIRQIEDLESVKTAFDPQKLTGMD